MGVHCLKRAAAFLLTIIMCLALFGCGTVDKGSIQRQGDAYRQETDTQTASAGSSTADNNSIPAASELKVHYIDVGQADSILVQQNGENMLIDAGNNDDADLVVSYLKQQGINKLDYLVLTHPHEDHIGGADAVIDTFKMGTMYMPKITAATKTFQDVLKSMLNKGLKAINPVPGDEFNLGDAKCFILAPNGNSYEDLNNYSIVIKLVYKSNSFLFTGDAQALSENEILKKGFDVKADVLKVGHHGSDTSTSDAFLAKVNPTYAVISVGTGNDYGHPHKETLDKLNAKGIAIYRTDLNGTIIAVSDGKSIVFSCEKGNPQQSSVLQENGTGEKQYIDDDGKGLIKGNINSKGEKIYHIPGSAYYDETESEAWFKTESEAQAAGFRKSAK